MMLVDGSVESRLLGLGPGHPSVAAKLAMPLSNLI